MKLFEQSWEVCNKVGGIYTVISSKAKYIKKEFGDNYFLIGPYKNSNEFIEKEKPEWLYNIDKELNNIGIKIHYGYWNIDGEPNVILLDFYDFMNKEKNYWKYIYWEWYKIDSLNSDFTFDEPLLWSISVGILLEKIDNIFKNELKILHAHEWLSGGTILYIKKKNLNYKTILTIHGTVFGRTISEKRYNIFDVINDLDFDKDCYRLNIQAKYQLEKNSVLNSDIFTVVSDILSFESEKIFKRKADKILYNYLDIKDIDFDDRYYRSRNNLREFLLWYFYPNKIDLEKTLFIYTIGRYEYYNKGYDLFIELIDYLRKNSSLNIIAFIFVPYANYGIEKNVYNRFKEYMYIKDYLDENKLEIIEDIIYKNNDIFKISSRFNYNEKPSIITHYIDQNNEIYNELLKRNFDNDNNVKIIYAPIYLGQDIIFNYKPEEFLPAFDFGIFLSRYEPYGYTPLEALYYGNNIILSSYSGFSYAIRNKIKNNNVIKIIDIKNINFEEIRRLFEYYNNLSLSEKLKSKYEAYKISKELSWDKNINEYIDLYKTFLY